MYDYFLFPLFCFQHHIRWMIENKRKGPLSNHTRIYLNVRSSFLNKPAKYVNCTRVTLMCNNVYYFSNLSTFFSVNIVIFSHSLKISQYPWACFMALQSDMASQLGSTELDTLSLERMWTRYFSFLNYFILNS